LAFTQAVKCELLKQEERMNRRVNLAFSSVCLSEEVKLKKVTFEWIRKERQKYSGGEIGEKDGIFHSWLL
jgi:hypothetical protein